MAGQTGDQHERAAVVIDRILLEEEKIAALHREIKNDNKAIKQIETSNTWKFGKRIHIFRDFFNRLFNRRKVYEKKTKMAVLQQRLHQTEMELLCLQEKLHIQTIKEEPLTTADIQQTVRELKDQSLLMSALDKMITAKKVIQGNLQKALVYTARLYMNHDKTYRNHVYEKILSALPIEEIPEFMIRAGLDEPSIPLHSAVSFRASLNMRMRKLQIQTMLPEWHLDDKQGAYQFVTDLGVPVPTFDKTIYVHSDIPVQEGIVIKPKNGAGGRGVYIVHSTNHIVDIKRSIKLTSWDRLMESMGNDLTTEAVDEDKWIVESLIYEKVQDKTPARDLKFYSFYGRVGAVLEIIRYPEIRHAWWTREGKRMKVGKYDESLYSGDGFAAEEVEMAEKISAEIPAPFLRIDFLRGEDGLVFGEFTPKPGNYDEFDDQTDQVLGDLFLEAEERLVDDLLGGKTFSAYKNYVKEHG